MAVGARGKLTPTHPGGRRAHPPAVSHADPPRPPNHRRPNSTSAPTPHPTSPRPGGDTITARPALHSLTGAHALNALDDDERAAFEAHLRDCDPCREEVEGFAPTVEMLAGAVAVQPPPHLKGAILDTVARTRQEPPPHR